MKKSCPMLLITLLATSAFAGVTVSKPSDGSTVQSPVNYVASATASNCDKGVASMGIYTAPYKLAYSVNGSSLNTNLSLEPGTYHTVVIAWNYCGGADTKDVDITVKEGSGVFVSSPSNNGNVGSPVHYVASASTTCPQGVAAMGIYTAPYKKAYVGPGDKLDTYLSLSPGKYKTTVVEWDKCGGADSSDVAITVTDGGGGGGGHVFRNLQASKGWQGYGELPPKYDICSDCSPEVTWSMHQGITSPSMTGNATRFDLGGTQAYADALWNNHLIGDGSSQGMLDSDHQIVPTLHNFTYDAYFYGTHLELSEALEFDIGQFFDGMGFMFGTECRVAGGKNDWAIWDNVDGKWDSTGGSCYPNNNSWNHVVIQFQRTSDNQLLYKSITLNGHTVNINRYYHPFSAPGWYGLVANFQLDGNYKQSSYSVYLDQFNLTYY